MFGFFKKKQLPSSDVSHQIASSITNLLSVQLSMCKSSNKIGDDWTIGYFGGFVDQVCTHKGIGSDDKDIAVMLLVLGSIFGDENRVSCFKKYVSLVESNDKAAIEGDRVARNDVAGLLSGASRRALGLSMYCNGMVDQYLEVMDKPLSIN